MIFTGSQQDRTPLGQLGPTVHTEGQVLKETLNQRELSYVTNYEPASLWHMPYVESGMDKSTSKSSLASDYLHHSGVAAILVI